jgi:DNA-binding MarR family transcriptional regulator
MRISQINKLQDAVKVLRDVHGEMTVNQILALLEVAKGNGVTGRDIEAACDLKQSTASRIIRQLDAVQQSGKGAGLNLVEARLDPRDYRNRLRYLSPLGEELIEKLDVILND